MSYIGNTNTTQAFTPAVDFFNGNGSTTAFTLSKPVASVAQVQAVISNVPQNPGDAFTVSGNTITFTSAPPSGTSNIYVYYTSPITQVIAPGQGTVAPASLSQGGPSWDTSGNVTLTGNITLNNGTADGAQLTLASSGYSDWNIDNYNGRFRWYYGATEYLTLDTSGNLGLGVTPSGWDTAIRKGLQLGLGGVYESDTRSAYLGNTSFGGNYYYNSGWKYIGTDYASRIEFKNDSGNAGAVVISGSASGTAGNAITWSDLLTLKKDNTVALQGATQSSGTGIAFPATQSASSNANTLDDYEEGTWTPAFAFGGATTGITYNSQVGRYTKVGRVVTVQCYVYLSNKGSASGAVTITGLPFNAAGISNNYCAVAAWGNSMTGLTGGLIGYVQPSNSYLYLYCTTTGSVQAINQTNFGNSTDWMITTSYIVD